MLTVDITYDVTSRLLRITNISTGVDNVLIGTTGDDLSTMIRCTFEGDVSEYDSFWAEFDVRVPKSTKKNEYLYPSVQFIPDNSSPTKYGLLIPAYILSNTIRGDLPMQIALENSEAGTRTVSLNKLHFKIADAVDADHATYNVLVPVPETTTGNLFHTVVGDGVNTTFDIVHNLETPYIDLFCYANTQFKPDIQVAWERVSDNVVRVEFSEPPGVEEYTVCVYIPGSSDVISVNGYTGDVTQEEMGLVTGWQAEPDDTHFPSEKLIKDSLEESESGWRQAIADEAAAREAADSDLQDAIDEEATAREAEDSNLQTAISNEITRATAVETQLRDDLTTEIGRATNAETSLQSSKRDKITGEHTEIQAYIQYGTSQDATNLAEGAIDIAADATTGGTLVRRTSEGRIKAVGPSENDDVANKSYTDTADNLRILKANIVSNDWQVTPSNDYVPSELLTKTKIDAVQTNLNTHTSRTDNPHSVTKTQVGLGDVVNQGMDSEPIQNSVKYVTSGGVYTAIENEATRATNREDAIASDLADEVSARQTAVSNEADVRQQADTTLQGNIDALATQTQAALDTKRDKITAQHENNPVVYTQAINGTEGLYDLTDNTTGGTIPVRNSSGKLTSNGTVDGDANTIVSTKGYTDTKDALKIDKTSIVTTDWQTTSDDTHVPSELLTRTKINAVQTNLNTHTSNTNNPHEVSKAQVGLGSVENQPMDSAPTENSVKYVTSGGVYTAIKTVQDDLDSHEADKSNPHEVSKAQVGLGNCDNTSDADKPISTATQTALDGKLDDSQLVTVWSSTVSNDNIPSEKLTKDTLDTKVDKTTTVNGHALSGNVTVSKSDVGLGNCDNTSDLNKPVSTAQQTALDGKVDKTTTVNGHALSSNVTVTKGDVGLGNCDNTSDADKPVSTAQQTALDSKLDDSQLVDTFTGHISDDTYIPSAKLVSTALDTKVDKTFDSSLFDGASIYNNTQSGASIQFTTKDTNTGTAGTSVTVALPVASGGSNGKAGLATTAQIDQIEKNRQDIALLSGKSSRYAINENLTGQTASQVQTTLTNAWEDASGETYDPPDHPAQYTTLVNLWNNHEYTWLTYDDNGTTKTEWVDRGISTVSIATNSSLGVVLGTDKTDVAQNNGNIWVDSNGMMQVIGWDVVKGNISDNASAISSLQSGKVDKLTTKPTAGTYTKLTINTEGQVTSGTTLSASDIPVLDWSKITTGKPTTLSGYGITDAVQSNTTITGATKCKITYDSKGLVTAGADLSASDIPALTISKITNLQTSLDAKLDDTQLVDTFTGYVSDDTYIPSAKLVNTELGKKQATLESGTNIKTINSASILGSGNIALQTPLTAGTDYQVPLVGSGTGQNIKTVNNNSLVGTGNVAVQEVLVGSGTGQNIKTVGGTSILGSGNIPFPTVTNSNPTLAWGTKSKVGSVGSTDLEVTMPTNPVTKTKIETELGVSATYNNQALIVKNGVIDFGEAGKVDDVQVNGTSVVFNKIASITVPTKVSDLQNDTGFITGLTFDELSQKPTTLAGYGITDAQSTLVSGTNIKTVNNNSLLGSGNVSVGTVQLVLAGVGLTTSSGFPIQTTGTIKAKLKSEDNATYDSNTVTNIDGRQYAVVPDKTNGYLSVNVPWVNNAVQQTESFQDNDYPILASSHTGQWAGVDGAYKSSGVTVNPFTGTLTAPHFYNSTTNSSLDLIVGSITSLTEVD